ncbi:MAG: fibronectin type III domain-containing protein [Armatimonadota bacterium]
MTLFDFGQLVSAFGSMLGDPNWNPDADLDGDDEVTLFDFGILERNLGLIGAEEFAGSAQSASGNWSATLRVELGDWTAQTSRAVYVLLQFKRVGTEGDPNTPIYEQVVSFGQGEAEKDVSVSLPFVGIYTVRALAYDDVDRTDISHWLRSEAVTWTEVPWIFAAPTGANKVTVYWDEVPGATGYRVRWGVQSGSYPNASGLLPASARSYTVQGLVSEQEYYFVVEAEYNGIWGPPSVEDSAVPHEGAIPWDTQNPYLIIFAVRNALGVLDGEVGVLSPDNFYYTDAGGVAQREPAPLWFLSATGEVITADGGLFMPTTLQVQPGTNERTGPYRRVKSAQGITSTQARGEFYLPPARHPSLNIPYISIPDSTWKTTRDTPHVYFGIEYTATNRQQVNIEGGLAFHPAGRGVLSKTGQERGATTGTPPPNYDRWNIFIKFSGRRDAIAVAGTFGNHLSYGVYRQDAPYGFVVWMMFGLPQNNNKLVALHVHAWKYLLEETTDPPSYKRVVVGCAYKMEPAQAPAGASRVKRVISMAQKEGHTGTAGWRRSQSFLLKLGVARTSLFTPEDLEPISLFIPPSTWQIWSSGVSAVPEHFPATGVISLEQPVNPYYREVVNIDLR